MIDLGNIFLGMLALALLIVLIQYFFFHNDAEYLKREAERLEREEFIKAFTKDFGAEPAGEFWDLYH